MKKLMLFATVFALLASVISAEVFVTGHGGYSMLTLEDAKKEHKDTVLMMDSLFTSATKDHVEPGGAIFGKLDIMVPVLPFINLGPRFGIISALQSRIRYSDPSTELKHTIDGFAVPLMLGGNVSIPLGSNVSLNAFAFGGYAFGMLKESTYAKMLNTVVSNYAINYSSGALALDFSGGLDIKLTNFLKAGFNIGYRVCKFEEMKATEQVKYNNAVIIEKDALFDKASGDALPVDMSGLDIGAGLTIIF